MFSLLLALIYVSFISLGLPDSLLGSAWPQMQESLGVSLSLGGVISFLITASTILSSLMSHRVIQRFGTGGVTMCSVAMTALALLGFSLSDSFLVLCLWAIPYGLGAGSVDAALNNFVALHCKAKHMSWLHCFWGIGATGGPYIMGLCLSRGMGWQAGYRTISFLQMALTLILLLSLPLWKKQELPLSGGETVRPQTPQWRKLLKRPGVKAALTAFFFYSALELTTGLWGSSYMVAVRGISPETAAKWISLFYLGITAGRFFSGFLTLRFSDDTMVRLGEGTAIVGIILLLLPLHNLFLCVGLILTGRPHLSQPAPRHTPTVWKIPIPIPHGHPNGNFLSGQHHHASCIRLSVGKNLHGAVSCAASGLCPVHDHPDGKRQTLHCGIRQKIYIKKARTLTMDSGFLFSYEDARKRTFLYVIYSDLPSLVINSSTAVWVSFPWNSTSLIACVIGRSTWYFSAR